MLGGPMFDGLYPFIPRQFPKEMYPNSDEARANRYELAYWSQATGRAVHYLPLKPAEPVTIYGADLVHAPSRAMTPDEVTRNILAGQPAGAGRL